MNFQAIREAAAGRCGEIIAALTPLPADVVNKRANDHPCPVCGGESVIWPIRDDGGANIHGRIACRNCTTNRPTGDVIATVAKFGGHSQGDAARLIGEYLGVQAVQPNATSASLNIIEQVAKLKRMPVDAFVQYGVSEATRQVDGVEYLVARVVTYNESGAPHSHYDLGVGCGPLRNGMCPAGSGSSGMFFPGRLPKPCEQWHIVEGVKDAAALLSLGYATAGTHGAKLAPKYAELFAGVHVTIVPDLDRAGFMDGMPKTAGNLLGIAESVRVARLPGTIKPKNGDGVREVLRRDGGEAQVRKAIGQAKPWTPENYDGDDTELTEERSADSVGSVLSVLSVSSDQDADLMAGIAATADMGVDRKNSGIFAFARKVVAILDGPPDSAVVEQYGILWAIAAADHGIDIDSGVAVAELRACIERVHVPDTGQDPIALAMVRASARSKPAFVAQHDDHSATVKLAKVICELDKMLDGGVFFLSCRKAGEAVGISHKHASVLLKDWTRQGILAPVQLGKPGPPGSPASRYRLLAGKNGDCSARPAVEVATKPAVDRSTATIDAATIAHEPIEEPPIKADPDEPESIEADPAAQQAVDQAPMSGFHCPWCRSTDLEDEDDGLRCQRCDRLAYVDDGGSLIRVDVAGQQPEAVFSR